MAVLPLVPFIFLATQPCATLSTVEWCHNLTPPRHADVGLLCLLLPLPKWLLSALTTSLLWLSRPLTGGHLCLLGQYKFGEGLFGRILILPLGRTKQGLLYFRLSDAAPSVTARSDNLWTTVLGGDFSSHLSLLGVLNVSDRDVSPTGSFIKAGISPASSWSFLLGDCFLGCIFHLAGLRLLLLSH